MSEAEIRYTHKQYRSSSEQNQDISFTMFFLLIKLHFPPVLLHI